MTWLGALRRSVENPQHPLTSQALIDVMVGPATDAGVNVSEKSALGLPAAYRAIALIAGTCAGLPLHAYRDRGEVRERMPSQPVLVSKPHPDMTPFEWAELVYVHLLGWGNAYLRKSKQVATGRVTELWPIEPSRVRVGRAKDGSKVYGIDADGDTLPLTDEEILHIPGLGYDGTAGMSPIRAARQAIGLAMATEKHGARFFGSGTMLSGVLSTDQRIDTDTADRLKARWKSANAGLDNAHDIAVLGSGTNFTPISVNPSDAQFIETQKFSVAQIARIFGVPPHLLMDTEKSTSWGTGIEQQSIGFVTYTLRPWLIRVEQRLSRLLPQPQYVKFAVEGLLRGDTKARYESYAVGRNWGWLSVNDIRRLEDMSPVDGGESYLQPLNMTTLTSSGEDSPRDLVEMVQKVYLGVGSVLSKDEAREILNRAGAGLEIPAPEDGEPIDA